MTDRSAEQSSKRDEADIYGRLKDFVQKGDSQDVLKEDIFLGRDLKTGINYYGLKIGGTILMPGQARELIKAFEGDTQAREKLRELDRKGKALPIEKAILQSPVVKTPGSR